jgi:hypothetical protein
LHLQPQRWRTIARRAGKRGGRSHLLDDYPAFVGAKARPNTWLAVAYDPSPKVYSVEGGTLTSRSSKPSWSALRSWPGRSGYRRATS